jgi:hypothetical protein
VSFPEGKKTKQPSGLVAAVAAKRIISVSATINHYHQTFLATLLATPLARQHKIRSTTELIYNIEHSDIKKHVCKDFSAANDTIRIVLREIGKQRPIIFFEENFDS